VVVVPASALSSVSGGPAVWVVDAETLKVTLKPVSVASYQSHSVIIEGGLEPGERVVTAGAKVLHPNQVVALATDHET
jgi:multidrug efflux pump subunit AcrA (membrane-fusion protein)